MNNRTWGLCDGNKMIESENKNVLPSSIIKKTMSKMENEANTKK